MHQKNSNSKLNTLETVQKLSLIAATMLSTALISTPAFAQEDADENAVEEIVVTGTRQVC